MRHLASTIILVLLTFTVASAQDEPMAAILNDEGGVAVIRGQMAYTNPFLTAGTSEPLVILEDQGGFVVRDEGFSLPPQSQTMGQITSDFFTSPFTYSLALPFEPQGTFRDVDNDGVDEQGIQVFVAAYWSNIFGDPFLEERDLFGAGWSSAYTTATYGETVDTFDEILGGKLLIFSPDDQQSFPSSFGEDGLLFTGDEPAVRVPQGYTMVDLDAEPFTFDRSRVQVADLLEPDGAALVDFSNLNYLDAFDAMLEKMRLEYAFTEFKGIDWDALNAEFRPRFEEAQSRNDRRAYQLALRDFLWSIPDGHVGASIQPLADLYFRDTRSGVGIALREFDDGRVIVSFVTGGSPADTAGILPRAEVLDINGVPVKDAIATTLSWSSPFSTDHNLRLSQLRYVTRFPIDMGQVDITYRNPGDAAPTMVTLAVVEDPESFEFSAIGVSQGEGITGFEQPLDYRLLENNIAYVQIYSFFDDERLSVLLWERLMESLRSTGVNNLVIDMRQNGGGSPFLATQLAAYFFDEELDLGNSGRYQEEFGGFYFNPETERQFFLPPNDLRYRGDIAVLIGPQCASACESFAYAMSLQDRATIVGQYPTAGLGGGIDAFRMPDGQFVQFTVTRNVDASGNIHIEGQGVAPTLRVPVTEETLFAEEDVILEAAIEHLLNN